MTLSLEALNVLLLLLPGFISGQILYSIFGPDDISPMKRILDAVMLSFIINLLVPLMVSWEPLAYVKSGTFGLEYYFSKNIRVIYVSLTLIIALPLTIGYVYYNDYIHSLLRRLQITTKSSRQNTWNDTFLSNNRYVVVSLKDGRRIRGYPLMVSTDPKDGYIYLYNPAWVNDDKTSEEEPNYFESNCHGFLLSRENIDLIEFTLEAGETLCKST